ncbi:MAG TPA: hypothetical protein PK467_17525 [Candidatus Wallbacteria bacterium]|nr:hypothetical protein [Candidatus Wallbacteria bacterium]
MITAFTRIKKAIDKRSGFVLPLVVVFLGSFFTMATIFYLFNLNQRPVVDILDRSAFADYIASGMAEILKLKVKEFPEEFRDTMKLIEFMQKHNQKPWDDIYLAYSGSGNEAPHTYFFQDFVVKKSAFNQGASDAWASDSLIGGKPAEAWEAHWNHMLHYLLTDETAQYGAGHDFKDNAAFKAHFKTLLAKYNVLVNLRDVRRDHIGLTQTVGGSEEYIGDIITFSFESQYRDQQNHRAKRSHVVTFNHTRKFTN